MTTATRTTKKARQTCQCPLCNPTTDANGVYYCRAGVAIEFLAYYQGGLIAVGTKRECEDKLNAHRHEIARRALQAATLTPDQADVIADELAPAADLAHDVAQAAAEHECAPGGDSDPCDACMARWAATPPAPRDPAEVAAAEAHIDAVLAQAAADPEVAPRNCPSIHEGPMPSNPEWLAGGVTCDICGATYTHTGSWRRECVSCRRARLGEPTPIATEVVDSTGTLFPIEVPDPRDTPEYRRYTEPRREEFIPMSIGDYERLEAEREAAAATTDMIIIPNPALLDHPNHADLKAMHTQARAMITELDAMAADEDESVPFDYDAEMQAAATALLRDEEARDFCEEARAEFEPVVPSFATDYIATMIDGCEARINALFPTEAEVNARAGRDELYPASDADLACTEIGLDLSREITALEQHDATHLLTARAYLIVARSAVENARKALKDAAEAEQRDEQRQADKAA